MYPLRSLNVPLWVHVQRVNRIKGKYFKVIQKYFESILSFCKPLKEIAAL